MADHEKEKSTNEILQALDALSQLYQSRANRRTKSLALPRSGSGSSKDGDDARVVDAAVKEARPRLRRRSSLTSPSWSKPKLDKNENDDDQEEGDDAALIIIIKNQGSSADEARPQPRHRFSLTLPFQSRSVLDKKEDDDDEEDDDSMHSAPLKSQGFTTATPEAYEEKKGIMSWDPIRARSHIGMRRIGCLFSMEVVAALGLPQTMNGLRLAVTVRKKETRDGAVQTRPARVQLGAAYFDEALYVRCHLYGTGEPQPFLLSLIAIDAPELDFGRSTVDLSLFAKEFADNCVRQWDMVFPLAGKAKGGELVVKLAFQSIDSQPAGEEKTSSKILTPKIIRSEGQKVVDKKQRKLRRSSISNMLSPKMTRTKTPKIGVPAPNLRNIDSFKLDEAEPELTPIDEVKETQQKESEHETTDELTSVADVKEEDKQKEPESKPPDEPTLVAEVEKEEQRNEPERKLVDEPTLLAEAKKEKEQQKEPADEPTLVAEAKRKEQHKDTESEPADEPTPVAKVKEEEEQKELESEPTDNPTLVVEVKEEEEKQKEPEREPANEPTPVAKVEEEQQKEPESDPADDPTLVVEVNEEEEKLKETESEPADEPTPVADMKEEEEKQKETKCEPAEEPTLVAEVKEEKQEEFECEPEHMQENSDSELLEFKMMDKGVDRQQVKAKLLKEEAQAMKGSEEEVVQTVANGLEEKYVEATMPSDVLDVVAGAVEPMDTEAAQSEEVIGESLRVPEQKYKGAVAKPPRPRFKWRTVAFLVPVSVLINKTLGVNR